MEDDKLKSLFSGYDRELSSDFDFMSRVRQNMNYIDLIKQEARATRRSHRKTMVISALAGFIVGILFSRTIPYITSAITSWSQTIPDTSILRQIHDYAPLTAWLLIAALSITASLTAYDLTTPRPKQPL